MALGEELHRLLRGGDFTSTSTTEYAPGKDLLQSDVTVVHDADGTIKCINICLKQGR